MQNLWVRIPPGPPNVRLVQLADATDSKSVSSGFKSLIGHQNIFVAQRIERLTTNQEVEGSNPFKDAIRQLLGTGTPNSCQDEENQALSSSSQWDLAQRLEHAPYKRTTRVRLP